MWPLQVSKSTKGGHPAHPHPWVYERCRYLLNPLLLTTKPLAWSPSLPRLLDFDIAYQSPESISISYPFLAHLNPARLCLLDFGITCRSLESISIGYPLLSRTEMTNQELSAEVVKDLSLFFVVLFSIGEDSCVFRG